MVDEGIYLFFEKEISAEGECVPFWVIAPSDKFSQFDKLSQWFKMNFSEIECAAPEVDEDRPALRPLTRRQFAKCATKIKTILFVPAGSFLDLEFALTESVELVDAFRTPAFDNGLLFGVETFDANCFWTGSSIRRWFNTRFPLKPKAIKYAKPPSVLDLLYEFLEEIPNSQDNRLALDKTLSALSKEDRSFVENMLSGRVPKNSKKTQETSARILRALKEGMA
jgi:hypothetical protein